MARTMTSGGPTFSQPRWAGDYLDRNALVPGGAKLDPAQFNAEDAVIVDVGAAGAAQGAVSVPVSPVLSGPIPSGTVLDFGANKFARLTAAAAAGAATITVAALPTALVDADKATYPGVGIKNVPSGTLIGRTIAERDASNGFGPWTTGDDEVYLTAQDVTDFNNVADVELYRPLRIVKENFLPGFAGYSAGAKTAVRSRYTCTRGAD
jgi:hypothetical protein